MPFFNLAWTLYIQAGRCCLQKCPGHGVTASGRAVREGQALTVGAASSNIIPQVDALFSSLSEIRPAKIPPERTHRVWGKQCVLCTEDSSLIQCNRIQWLLLHSYTIHKATSSLTQPVLTWRQVSLFLLIIYSKYPRQKAFYQVPHGPIAGVLVSTHWSLNSSHAIENLLPCPCPTATRERN